MNPHTNRNLWVLIIASILATVVSFIVGSPVSAQITNSPADNAAGGFVMGCVEGYRVDVTWGLVTETTTHEVLQFVDPDGQSVRFRPPVTSFFRANLVGRTWKYTAQYLVLGGQGGVLDTATKSGVFERCLNYTADFYWKWGYGLSPITPTYPNDATTTGEQNEMIPNVGWERYINDVQGGCVEWSGGPSGIEESPGCWNTSGGALMRSAADLRQSYQYWSVQAYGFNDGTQALWSLVTHRSWTSGGRRIGYTVAPFGPVTFPADLGVHLGDEVYPLTDCRVDYVLIPRDAGYRKYQDFYLHDREPPAQPNSGREGQNSRLVCDGPSLAVARAALLRFGGVPGLTETSAHYEVLPGLVGDQVAVEIPEYTWEYAWSRLARCWTTRQTAQADLTAIDDAADNPNEGGSFLSNAWAFIRRLPAGVASGVTDAAQAIGNWTVWLARTGSCVSWRLLVPEAESIKAIIQGSGRECQDDPETATDESQQPECVRVGLLTAWTAAFAPPSKECEGFDFDLSDLTDTVEHEINGEMYTIGITDSIVAEDFLSTCEGTMGGRLKQSSALRVVIGGLVLFLAGGIALAVIAGIPKVLRGS